MRRSLLVILPDMAKPLGRLQAQHTGLTDLPLTERGEHNARRLGLRLSGLKFAKVFTSPSQRARCTCELAGFGGEAQVDPDLVEWNYGEYEGRLTSDILKERPDWQLFRDGCPGGESPQQVAARADRVVSRVRRVIGDVLIFPAVIFYLVQRWAVSINQGLDRHNHPGFGEGAWA